jgi:transglutaminase/protease-like cytokinesis protein 3
MVQKEKTGLYTKIMKQILLGLCIVCMLLLTSCSGFFIGDIADSDNLEDSPRPESNIIWESVIQEDQNQSREKIGEQNSGEQNNGEQNNGDQYSGEQNIKDQIQVEPNNIGQKPGEQIGNGQNSEDLIQEASITEEQEQASSAHASEENRKTDTEEKVTPDSKQQTEHKEQPSEANLNQPKPTPTPVVKRPSDSKAITPSFEANSTTMKKIKQIIEQIIQEDMQDVDKVKAVHDYIVLNTRYDYDNLLSNTIPEISFTAEGVLAKQIAVCQGYAFAFQLFMEQLSIGSKVVVGTDLKTGLGHAWNMVKLDGNWYHVDTTWDDPVPDKEGTVQYNYFLITDEVLEEDHDWIRSDYPDCDREDYQYYIYKDVMITSLGQYEEKFMELYDLGERTITILYPEEGMPDFEFFKDYDYLWKYEGGKYTISKKWYPPWRLGDYTVLTVMMEE